ncbi:hydroperoxidase HPII(III) (catalase) [Moraxellaceae bacterium 17A]|nr:hydroperoxidase HPII(III) (catalase) [Moraxellaceae bacterium 17A]
MTQKPVKPEPNMNTQQGNASEAHQQADDNSTNLTTQQGIVIADNQNSLRAGRRGPALLEDFILREKITHFDHERIPERIVHARGSAAHGYFELTESLEHYTTAKVLTEVGEQTPLFTRFSTVAGGAGSVDTPRDIRGFAVKIYTKEGNWDLVGNNTPVFFIQDAIKFPDLVHAVKMEPDRGFPQAASAHDTFYDFISLSPETLHNFLWAMSDRGIPRSLRMIEGFGIHSYRFINAKGESTFVRFHWRPRLELQSHIWDEAVKVAGADPDYHRRDLFEALQQGDEVIWDFAVQLFTQEQADEFPFDHLDATKLIPEELVPLKVVGKMVLNRYPDNFFAETEQVAFCPANIVPGIDFSNDPLLQGRLFSYLDTQLSRLGSPNFAQLPINAPKCPFHNMQRDGHMQMQIPKGRVAYEPQSLEPEKPRENPAVGFKSFAEDLSQGNDTVKGRIRSESFADFYSQPRMFYRSQTPIEQAHIASAIVFELSKVETPYIRERMVAQLLTVDETLGKRVADGLGMKSVPKPIEPTVPVQDLPLSPALQLIGKAKPTLEGRKVAILVADDSNAEMLEKYKAAISAAKATPFIVAPKISITLNNGETIAADGQLAGSPSVLFDAIVSIIMPEQAKKLAKVSEAIAWFKDAHAHLKAIAYCGATDEFILIPQHIEKDASVVALKEIDTFIEKAKSREWNREPHVRDLA